MNKATEWLNDPDRSYADGLKIYKEHLGMDKNYAFFSEANDPQPGGLHFNLLTERLRVVQRKVEAQPKEETKADLSDAPNIKVIALKGKRGPHIVDNPFVDIKDLPEDLQKKFLENKELVKTISGAHAAIKSATTDEERAAQLAIATEAEELKDANWLAIDAWWKEFKDSKKPEAPEDNKALRQETIRKAISRAEKDIKDGNIKPAQVLSRETKIAAWKQELKDLKSE